MTGVETAVCGSTWEKAQLDPVRYDNVRQNELILYGIPGFDNYFQAMLTVFQVCTLESWAYLMNDFADANEHGFLSYFYFPMIIFIGGFFTMNLILAHILDKFEQERLRQEQEDKLLKETERLEQVKRHTEQLQADLNRIKLEKCFRRSLTERITSKTQRNQLTKQDQLQDNMADK